MALFVSLSRFMSSVGGGSAFWFLDVFGGWNRHGQGL
jgi:hypothetical protein